MVRTLLRESEVPSCFSWLFVIAVYMVSVQLMAEMIAVMISVPESRSLFTT